MWGGPPKRRGRQRETARRRIVGSYSNRASAQNGLRARGGISISAISGAPDKKGRTVRNKSGYQQSLGVQEGRNLVTDAQKAHCILEGSPRERIADESQLRRKAREVRLSASAMREKKKGGRR